MSTERSATSPERGRSVFVSYSHKDRRWLERLQIHLKPLEQRRLVELWDDTRIKPGSIWRDEIRQAVASARVAVLLVSANFLASKFITTNELPPLLARAESAGTVILPIIVAPSRFEDTEELARFQAVNPPSQPLVNMRKAAQERLLVDLTHHIEDALETSRPQQPPPEPSQTLVDPITDLTDRLGVMTDIVKDRLQYDDSGPRREEFSEALKTFASSFREVNELITQFLTLSFTSDRTEKSRQNTLELLVRAEGDAPLRTHVIRAQCNRLRVIEGELYPSLARVLPAYELGAVREAYYRLETFHERSLSELAALMEWLARAATEVLQRVDSDEIEEANQLIRQARVDILPKRQAMSRAVDALLSLESAYVDVTRKVKRQTGP